MKSLTCILFPIIWSPEVEDSVDKLNLRVGRAVKGGKAGEGG